MRGADTLAAALSVPLLVRQGTPFPSRSAIIFVAYAVILATLVLQGLSLPPLIRRLGLGDEGSAAREEAIARRAAAEAALARLDAIAAAEDVPEALLSKVRARYAHQAHLYAKTTAGAVGRTVARHLASHNQLQRDALAAERQAVIDLRDRGVIGDEVFLRIERDLDLEEERVDT